MLRNIPGRRLEVHRSLMFNTMLAFELPPTRRKLDVRRQHPGRQAELVAAVSGGAAVRHHGVGSHIGLTVRYFSTSLPYHRDCGIRVSRLGFRMGEDGSQARSQGGSLFAHVREECQ